MARVSGENGHAEVHPANAGSPLLVLFERLMRGVGEDALTGTVDEVLAGSGGDRGVAQEDLFVLAMHTRWCRGGKGERAAAFALLFVLFEHFPDTVLAAVGLLPHFGSWRDLVLIAEEATRRGGDHARLASACWDMIAHELEADSAILCAHELQRGKPPNLSLAAKYAPSEHARKNKRAQVVRGDLEVCARLFGHTGHAARREYRKLLSHLRRALDVCETLMCAGRWDELEIGSMPARALKQYKRALLNEGRGGPRESPARARCRERFLALLADPAAAGIKGAQLFPHELVEEALARKCSRGVHAVLNAQWGALAAKTAESGIGQARMVCMADVSGSMTGTPMHVAIGLGLLLAQLSHPSFRNRVLTFSADARWHELPPDADFVSRVQSLSGAHWGFNTDFGAALDRIADVVSEQGLQQHEVPDLLVVSDMQFDAAHAGLLANPADADWKPDAAHAPDDSAAWRLAHERIAARFHDLGCELHGAPLLPPQIVFWNVRAGAHGLQAQADTPGVVLLSGYSPAIMHAFLSNDKREAAPVQHERKTPAQALRAVLDLDALEIVRDLVRSTQSDPTPPCARATVQLLAHHAPAAPPRDTLPMRDIAFSMCAALTYCVVVLNFVLPFFVLLIELRTKHPPHGALEGSEL